MELVDVHLVFLAKLPNRAIGLIDSPPKLIPRNSLFPIGRGLISHLRNLRTSVGRAAFPPTFPQNLFSSEWGFGG